jgi:cytoskeletal protein CcmA (bactofilin family)
MDRKDQTFEEKRLEAWVGTALLVRGDIVASTDLVIHGRVEGTIELGDHSLTIGEGASVVADLVANSVSVSGSVKGNVTGHTRVELHAGSVVEGDIRAPNLIMEDGAILRGRVDTDGRRP